MNHWQAEFVNGETLSQYDENNKERLFKCVLDRIKELKTLSVIINNTVYKIDLTNTKFTINFVSCYLIDINPDELENIRPIYFIREQVSLNLNETDKQHTPATLFTALGFQANYNGRNVKRVIAIFNNGTWVLHEN
jgi:hypothetical protein